MFALVLCISGCLLNCLSLSLSHTHTHTHTHTQGSAELTSHLLPEIAKLLMDHDETVVLEASKILHELSKKEASCRALIANGAVINTLIHAMTSTANAEIHKSLVGTLHNLSRDQ